MFSPRGGTVTSDAITDGASLQAWREIAELQFRAGLTTPGNTTGAPRDRLLGQTGGSPDGRPVARMTNRAEREWADRPKVGTASAACARRISAPSFKPATGWRSPWVGLQRASTFAALVIPLLKP